jgi:acetyl esterase/lipase
MRCCLLTRNNILFQHSLRAADRLNLAFITPDFRLAPQATMSDIMDDIADCVQFITSGQLARQLGDPTSLNADRYILSGSSAGGWGALMLGLGLLPRYSTLPVPMAVIAIYPITTVAANRAPYFHKPLKPLPWAYSPQAKIGQELIPDELLRGHMDRSTSVLVEAHPMVLTSRAPLYTYARQEGIYPNMALGIEKAEEYCVPSLIGSTLSSTKTASVPSLVLIAYGDADVMVEVDQSEQAIKALQDCGAPFQLGVHVEAGKNHIWDILDPTAEIPTIWDKLSAVLREKAM